ncbi:hypothetical protein CLOSTMETH_03374 [[Clostridium] methylpentosum DSM 5476]|uniref:Uncharacterized protein n=1 Tax=[Clostridium] methylpentosum DSM 5476 TaxID=537013 RepID=C0EHM9_9FIRM|nr:hypothetical protein CLOSTMETH_03374 [[Clostridium] methylpentosum DSM 5476]
MGAAILLGSLACTLSGKRCLANGRCHKIKSDAAQAVNALHRIAFLIT